jgi:hypothetical protein
MRLHGTTDLAPSLLQEVLLEFLPSLPCSSMAGGGEERPLTHLELAPQVGHLVQPMLLNAPAAAPLA